MEFKDKLKLHCEGKYDLSGELLTLALSEMVDTEMYCIEVKKRVYNKEDDFHEEKTFRRWRARYYPKRNLPECHVAFQLKVILSKHAKKANQMKSVLDNGSQEQRAEFDGLDYLYTALTDEGYHYHVDDFDKVPTRVLREIKHRYGKNVWGWTKFETLFKEYKNILPAANREKQKYFDEIAPLIKLSLEEVLPKVDLTRTNDEIIGLITISVKRKTYRKLNKTLQTKVVNRKGEKYWVNKIDLKFKKVNIDSMLQVDEGKLTNNQMFFYRDLKRAIQKELNERNPIPFVIGNDKKFIDINKRYFSEMLGFNESAFKKRLKRLQDKKNKEFFQSPLTT